MRLAGLVIVVAGVWIITQVTAGEALQRLGVVE
ncbi:hypothetical protein JOE61_003856 [Nocardioides salarius]|uniref:Uncharacterized protein n=1 Tax=Nocardioides salarius TaxID=374513 RepID=A0ABS2MFT2_9ACTN|nr:hypothetical protein [Nocardioides salarius]